MIVSPYILGPCVFAMGISKFPSCQLRLQFVSSRFLNAFSSLMPSTLHSMNSYLVAHIKTWEAAFLPLSHFFLQFVFAFCPVCLVALTLLSVTSVLRPSLSLPCSNLHIGDSNRNPTSLSHRRVCLLLGDLVPSVSGGS